MSEVLCAIEIETKWTKSSVIISTAPAGSEYSVVMRATDELDDEVSIGLTEDHCCELISALKRAIKTSEVKP